MHRELRAHAIALTLLWGLPLVSVVVLHHTLPDHNADGTCEGIGFGCVPPPSDQVLFLGLWAAPFLFVAGLVAIVAIAWRSGVRRRSDR